MATYEFWLGLGVFLIFEGDLLVEGNGRRGKKPVMWIIDCIRIHKIWWFGSGSRSIRSIDFNSSFKAKKNVPFCFDPCYLPTLQSGVRGLAEPRQIIEDICEERYFWNGREEKWCHHDYLHSSRNSTNLSFGQKGIHLVLFLGSTEDGSYHKIVLHRWDHNQWSILVWKLICKNNPNITWVDIGWHLQCWLCQKYICLIEFWSDKPLNDWLCLSKFINNDYGHVWPKMNISFLTHSI